MGMKRMFWPVCDVCSSEEENYAKSWSSEVRDNLKKDGWTVNNKLICPSCNGSDPDFWKGDC